VFRLTTSIEYYVSQDATYHFSGLAISSFSENTCGFIVLSASSVKQILNRGGRHRTDTTGRSYERYGSGRQLESDGSRLDPTRVLKLGHIRLGGASDGDGYFRSEQADSIPITARDDDTGTFPGPDNSEPREHRTNPDRNNAILRTTEFTAVSHHSSQDKSRDDGAEQYPWVGDRRR
jgi:hypothetical protein